MRSDSLKTIFAFSLACMMVLPVGILVSGGTENSQVMIAGPGADARYSSLVQVGDTYYQVWIDGETHDARLIFSMSQDGESWSHPIYFTDTGDSVPMNVNMQAGKSSLHIIWQDGVSRLLRTGYMSVDLLGHPNRPVFFPGESPSMDVLEDRVAIATARSGQLTVHTSQDAGNNFQSQRVFQGLSASISSISLDHGLELVASAGIRDRETGQLSQRGLYHAYKTGTWSSPVMVSGTGPVRELAFDSGYITWTETSTRSTDQFRIKELAPGIFGERKLLSTQEVVPSQPASGSITASRLPPKKWTFIVYLDADNNLDSFGFEDFNEMEMIGSNADLNILVLFDRLGSGDTKAYYVQQDADSGTITSPEIPLTDINPGWGNELDMGDPQTAIDFVEYVYANYPAEHYVWDMWDHGGSWNWAMCEDDNPSGGVLTAQEVRSIYETLRADTGKITLFDVAGYDECLLSDVSMDYDETPYINYICNSEDSIAGDGWEYNIVLGHINNNTAMGGEEAASWVFQSYVERYGTSGATTTMSVINTTMFYLDLIPLVNTLAQKGIHNISANRANLQTAANNAQDWQGYTHQKDLVHFCQNIVSGLPANAISSAAQNVIDSAQPNAPGSKYGDAGWVHDKAIMIHNQNANENGVTIYAANPPYDTIYDTMTFTDTNWDEFYKVLWGADADQPNTEPLVTITSPADGGYVTTGSVVTITGTASDPDGTVQSVDVAIDTEHWAPASGTNSWSFTWDTTGWDIGWHFISARSYDGQDYSDPYIIQVRIIVDPDLPDLTLWPSDISFNNTTPNEGDTVTIDATAYNVGVTNASVNTEIGFYDGNPASGGTLIGVTLASPSTIPAGNNSGWGSVTWNTAGLAGFHNIYVVADPNHTVNELTDSNNTAFKAITVAGYSVDLACPVNTSTVQAGESHKYQINVTNTGTLSDTITLTINNPTSWDANFNDNPPSGKSAGANIINSASAPAGKSVNGYHTFAEIESEMQAIAAAHPAICQLLDIGNTWEGRDLWVMKVSDNVTVNETGEPETYIMGGIHAREWIADEVPLYYLNWLADNYGTDPEATWLVDNRQIYISPCVNPDGLEYCQTTGDWRKNRRDNGDGTFGVDLNRNWPGACNGDPNGDWGGAGTTSVTSDDTYCGPAPFSEPETQALRDFILAHDFQITFSYHSYAQDIYWPWGYDTAVQTPTDSYQSTMAGDFAAINGYTPMQSAASYFTTGDTDDWIYGYNWYNLSKEVYPFTIELGTQFQPPQSEIIPICQKNLEVNKLAARYADNLHMDSPVITQTPLNDTTDTTGPYTVTADITTPNGLQPGTTILNWRNTGAWNQVPMTNTGGNTWQADIPGQTDGTWVHYFIETEDVNAHRSTDPIYSPYEDHRFFVGNDVVEYTLTLGSMASRIVNLTVTAPFSALPNEQAKIDVIGTSDNDPAKTDSVETVTTVAPGILVVDDSGGNTAPYELALSNNGYSYDLGTPTTNLSQYRIVIWQCDGVSTLQDSEKTALADFLDSGGSVYINGEDIGYDIAGDNDTGVIPAPHTSFYHDYMHADYLADDSNGVNINGITGDPITDGMSNYAISGSFPSSIAALDAPASTIFRYDSTGTPDAGIKVDTGTYKLVYIACEYFEGADAQPNKDLLMDRIISWINPDSPPSVTLTNPAGSEEIFSGTIDVTWSASDDTGLGTGSIDLYYSDDAGGTWTPIASGLDNTGSYAWDTVAGGLPDGVSYMVRVDATDSIAQTSSDQSPECFSMDNTADDRWYFQVESTNLGANLDLDMKPCELTPQEKSVNITGTGEFLVGAYASEYIAAGDVDLAGDWTFSVNGRASSGLADGPLYAEVYADDGTSRLLFTTAYDNENIGTFLTNHEFNWVYTVPASTLINAGEHVVVHILLHAISGAATSPHSWNADADIPVSGTVTNDYTFTLASDDSREIIVETDGGGAPATYFTEDFSGGLGSWTIVNGGTGTGAAETWTTANPGARTATAPITDPFAIADSDELGSFDMDEELISPIIDMSGTATATLEFDQYFYYYSGGGNEYGDVDVRSSNTGGAWTNVLSQNGASSPNPDSQNIDISTEAADASDVQIRFHYYQANFDWYWMVDNVLVTGTISTSLLEHKWTVDVPAGEAPYDFSVEARRTDNAEGDDFVFAYSTDDVVYTDMVTVNSWTEAPYTYGLPAGLSGTIYIRVRDLDRTSGNTNLDSIEIDQMYISSVGGPPEFIMGLDCLSFPSYVEPVLASASLITMDIPVSAVPGWNFISFPLDISGSPDVVLNDLAGDGTTQWDVVKWYDATDPTDHWKSYNPAKPPVLNDLTNIDCTMGLWVHITVPGDNLLTVQGAAPVTTNINLYTGWNLVSYPSTTPRTADTTLPAQADMVAVYDGASPYLVRDETVLSSITMSNFNAYWVHVTADCVWSVNY